MPATDVKAEPLTVDAKRLGELPEPMRFGRRVLWSVTEVQAWIEAGMPDRRSWALRKAARESR